MGPIPSFFKDSVSKLVTGGYNEFEWLPWLFDPTCLDTKSVRDRFLKWAENKMGIKTPSDWYLVNPDVI